MKSVLSTFLLFQINSNIKLNVKFHSGMNVDLYGITYFNEKGSKLDADIVECV